ncbi:ABC transporter ATP-binding protein [Grimontia hollisae]|uniref:Aliphatic sulfonates import ATP-binding protein SsuB n=1 Tax=Grimontia hollisae TaxID=673 RepID=A0A377J991_GRIHO|nr:ATP-binding cassette domain-containing protein [Grimontia hollisae]MDF2184777.1 ATP-binding cassette domain-containing protein [Grimontia hollisae]STO98323.1 Aliphatic sulfonates import ATP-binding protein SsuB [Grimontia hollisae]
MISIALNIENKRFASEDPVLQAFRGEIKPGKITAIVGPSGCGKSTLLNMIAGLEISRQGEVQFSGIPGEHPRVGYIFQTPRLMPWLTTKENLELICGKDNPAIKDTLAAMGILDKQDAYPSQLSGGMQRRVSIARAFVYDPDLLLLDEPFTSLDAPTADQLRQQLIALWQRQQSTMLFVTHDLREAISLADEIWFLGRPPTCIIHTLSLSQPPQRLLGDRHGRQTIEDITSALLDTHPEILSGFVHQ